MTELIHSAQPALEEAVSAACYGLAENSARAYRRYLREFIAWWTPQATPFDRLAVAKYMDSLGPECSAARYNQTLAALKRLTSEAANHGWLAHSRAAEIDSLRSRPARGVRAGIWLDKEKTAKLLAAPNQKTLIGLRDAVVLALSVGCGLRRSEVCSITWEHLKRVDGKLRIMNLRGKGGRVRTLALSQWVEDVVVAWSIRAGLKSGPLVRSFRHDNGEVNPYGLSPSTVRVIVQRWSKAVGEQVAPHDLRRTFAKLARKGGAPLEVLQCTLGHASLTTTERYVNAGEEANAGDYLQL